MKIYILIILCALFLKVEYSQAQDYKNKLDSIYNTYRAKQANKSYENMAYTKAIAKYEKLNAKNMLPDSIKGILATAYLKVSDTESSEQVFASMDQQNMNNDQLFLYAQALKYNSKYAEADVIIEDYNKRMPDDSRAEELLNALPKIEKILAEERYLLEGVDFNSEEADFGPFVLNNELVFTSSRDLDYIIKREYAWKETPYLNVLSTKIKENGFSNPQLYSSDLRTMYHDGPACFNADGNEVFITRNGFHSLIKKKGADGYNNLSIIHSTKNIDGTWGDEETLAFNNETYSCGHASLSSDGTVLYFASDMPGGFGGSDIYAVTRSDGIWGEPFNLGKSINTEGEEMFPFIHENGRLYFTSNGRVGVGGLDIYVAEKHEEAYVVKNMGVPINSEKDDFSIFVMEDGQDGYFASNRDGGKGDDDIYRFKVLQEIAFKKGLKGKLINKQTAQVIGEAPVLLLDDSGSEIATVTTDIGGLLVAEVEDIKSITAVVNLPDYFPYEETIMLSEETAEFQMALVPRPYYGIYGSVFLLPDMTPVEDVLVSFYAEQGDVLELNSGDDGEFKTKLQAETDYDVVFTKKNFFTKRIQYSTVGRDTGYVNVNEFVELDIEKAEIGKSIEINILYDLGKWNIREDAAVELDDMVQFLKDNPDINIELGSHTDARGSAASNQSLSQKRAESAVKYMVENGIDSNRIAAKGYGETKLKNKCADGVKCSEAEHQANRRSEATITAM